MAFFRTGIPWPGLLKVHWVATVDGGSLDIAVCGKSTATHLWYAVNDAKDNALRKRLVACLGCCARAPDQFNQLPRML